MKAVNIKLNKNFPEHMSGREITIYIYKYNEKLNGNSNEVDDINEMNEEIKKKIIYTKADEEKYQFWFDFLIDVEKRLKEDNIQKRKNNGCADGDLYLGLYTSLRNESFTFNNIKKIYEFPPNEKGWNGSKQKAPFSKIQIYKIRKSLLNENYLILNIYEYRYYIISFSILLMAFLLYKIHNS